MNPAFRKARGFFMPAATAKDLLRSRLVTDIVVLQGRPARSPTGLSAGGAHAAHRTGGIGMGLFGHRNPLKARQAARP